MKTVPLHGKIAAGRVALVDDEDYPLVSQHRWHARECRTRNQVIFYACTSWGPRGGQTLVLMHNFIMGRVGIDHRDHDGLNNTRANLRPATISQNNANSRARAGKSSRYRGVTWIGTRRRWQAQIGGGARRSLGYFANEADAARAYDAAALAAFGEFATLNFPKEGRASSSPW